MAGFIPPKPATRPERAGPLKRLMLFRKNIFASQPERLYRAWMAEQKTPFYNSYFINQPELVDLILKGRPDDFPKSGIIQSTLRSLLGESVFVTNGEKWKRQRRIIDPSFEGGRVKDSFEAMVLAGEAAVQRISEKANGTAVEMEFETSYLAADIIFRTLFSVPITNDAAERVFYGFRDYQRSQPLLNMADILRLPSWVPRYRRRITRETARDIRALLRQLTETRMAEIEAGTAPNDLATKIMTTIDPQTGQKFDADEMVDQVAIFFLAGHETSASALAWTLYLLAKDPEVQERAAREAQNFIEDGVSFSGLSKLSFTRDVFREALRLYPPVPMMVRETTKPEHFRERDIAVGSLAILSSFHLQRHQRLWERPDEFDPDRWQTEATRKCAREAYMPFSAGPRVCTGAAFAMVEGVLMLAFLLTRFKFKAVPEKEPVPVAHLTLRSENGMWLAVEPRHPSST